MPRRSDFLENTRPKNVSLLKKYLSNAHLIVPFFCSCKLWKLLLLETQGVTDFKNFSGKRTKKGLKKVDSERKKINDQKECTYIDATVLRLTLANFAEPEEKFANTCKFSSEED